MIDNRGRVSPSRGFLLPMPQITKYLLTALLALLVSVAPLSAGYAGVYRWVDEQGRVHFGDRPPPKSSSENVDIKNDPSPGAPAPNAEERRDKQQRLLRAWEEERQQRKEASAKAKEDKKRQKQRCAVARDRLRTYKDASYLYDLDKDGNRKVISDADKQRAIRELEEAIKRHCR